MMGKKKALDLKMAEHSERGTSRDFDSKTAQNSRTAPLWAYVCKGYTLPCKLYKLPRNLSNQLRRCQFRRCRCLQ